MDAAVKLLLSLKVEYKAVSGVDLAAGGGKGKKSKPQQQKPEKKQELKPEQKPKAEDEAKGREVKKVSRYNEWVKP